MMYQDLYFTRNIGQAGESEHERKVNACLPLAATIANQMIRQSGEKGEIPENITQARDLANRCFFEAMNEATAAKGLRVL